MAKPDGSKQQKSNRTASPPLPEEELAQRAQRLNPTLLAHLPPNMRSPKDAVEEKALAELATKNCIRRINLNYPDDILTEEQFITVAKDLLQVIDSGTFFAYGVRNFPKYDLRKYPHLKDVSGREEVLEIQQQGEGNEVRRYLERNYITPAYRVSRPKKGKGRIGLSLRMNRILIFSPEGELKEIKFPEAPPQGSPSVPPFISPVKFYRGKGLLIEGPLSLRLRSKEFLRSSVPLFTFSQVGQMIRICDIARAPVDLLTTNPKEYGKLRVRILPAIKKILEERGTVRFCGDLTCMKPLPLDRDKYCSQRCRQSALNARKPKSTERVKKHHRKGLEPFISHTEIPTLLSTD